MKEKIKEIFNQCPETWTYQDLKLILDDLEEGGQNTKETIKEIINEIENDVDQCATCGQAINTEKNHFILEFGPSELRKEAYFCAIDCLQYFIEHIKTVKKNNTS